MPLMLDPKRAGLALAFTIGLGAVSQPAQATPAAELTESLAADLPATEQDSRQPIALDQFGAPSTQANRLQETVPTLAVAPATLEADSHLDGQLAQQPDRAANGRRTSGKFSYIGVGGAIGLSGDDDSSALGEGGFALLSKTAFSENLSLHNASILGNGGTSVIALTADFPIRNQETGDISIVPFVGGGLAISDLFGDDTDVGFALTGGIDVPLSYRWTATGRVAAAFLDDNTDVALLLGVGYTFTGFFK